MKIPISNTFCGGCVGKYDEKNKKQALMWKDEYGCLWSYCCGNVMSSRCELHYQWLDNEGKRVMPPLEVILIW